ncbi:uncharacterized protein LOC108034441 [Drosophila biarmipes]|uniref:uncharacterized protein LOC108034441 n=1 Tax=Drosophila biarmipes TaxID=125945 RepID=UPI0007E5DBFF|nr:uncharacterized protein LOC108034441 [Drosophila biarmipes]
MRLFVALVCVSLVASSSGQLSLRGRLGRASNVNLAVEQPTLLAKTAGIVPSVLVKNAGIVPSVLVKNAAAIVPAVDVAADVETPSILPQVSSANILPYYPGYWPDYGSAAGGWYPGAWNGPSYWNNNYNGYNGYSGYNGYNGYYDYGTPYLARPRFVQPVASSAVTPVITSSVTPVVTSAVSPSVTSAETPAASSSSSSTTTTNTNTVAGENSSDDSSSVDAAAAPEQDEPVYSTQVI